ncbi:hypothetical protein K227x_08490 [Rubripirellula lacrimiformis]|uniref:Uncharacterized protein n=1 Tax=Rubripirellula lacrimiformis TaxID=1930273 RepID=A0A517N5Q4_9BACT|nr:hypothetical protein [Rubripirellula lacrimiformis]QDT02472.1 hypothetical protein K227x_08490 [Rubripirellula lacrimiformis]
MSGNRRNRTTIELGHDSFLDIVANLVGILIILVVILGAQSTAVIEEIEEQSRDETVVENIVDIDGAEYATDQQMSKLAQQSMRAAAAQAESNRLERLVRQYDSELEARSRQRAMLLDLLNEAQAAWESGKQELDQKQTLAAARLRELQTAKSELSKLEGERRRLEGQAEPVVSVEHLPTPMAKTVFGDEIHLRLKGNLVSVVPVDRLVDEIKGDFKRVVAGTRDGDLDGAVGPVRGYVARYVMNKSRGLTSNSGRSQMATRVQLVGMTLEPLAEPHGQSIDKVLNGSSELDIELAGRNPGNTTITVWVYPDSFGAFRGLKERLYAKGFATAARPLPMGRPISGSPQGSRSSAQ